MLQKYNFVLFFHRVSDFAQVDAKKLENQITVQIIYAGS